MKVRLHSSSNDHRVEATKTMKSRFSDCRTPFALIFSLERMTRRDTTQLPQTTSTSSPSTQRSRQSNEGMALAEHPVPLLRCPKVDTHRSIDDQATTHIANTRSTARLRKNET